MESFIDYLLSEYNLPEDAVCHRTTFNHAVKVKVDKKTGEETPINIISMKIECYDKNHNLIEIRNEKFIDDHLIRPKNNKLKIIDEEEINNKFSDAKPVICDYILQDLFMKTQVLKNKIEALMVYGKPQEIAELADEE